MAYPTVSAPYGFKAINRVDGMAYAGAIRQLPIASNYSTAIFNGDVVKIVSGGTIEKETNTTDATPVGVLVGCQYVNSMGQTVQGQFFPGAGVTNPIAYVVDDPLAAFKVAVTNASSVVSTVAASVVGQNTAFVIGTGDAVSGNSGESVDAGNISSTSTLPFRVIAVVPETATSTGFTELVVKINTHQYNNPTGV
jgi:hypothetical protein